jgi:hypothetical protein
VQLVLAMRGGPINTRKVALPEEAARQIQEAVHKNTASPLTFWSSVTYFCVFDYILLRWIINSAEG